MLPHNVVIIVFREIEEWFEAMDFEYYGQTKY